MAKYVFPSKRLCSNGMANRLLDEYLIFSFIGQFLTGIAEALN